eukprot:TRINITY_DN5046_c0_g1_i2.p1 TRINITY_DN5046_c0_g1~~TRINITY_DN5046_c0_g1_i2.p1  ORF type:complete len:1198 (-),score=426.21 TRINITY_DN5046_c0_g1_i2:93-3641(-)
MAEFEDMPPLISDEDEPDLISDSDDENGNQQEWDQGDSGDESDEEEQNSEDEEEMHSQRKPTIDSWMKAIPDYNPKSRRLNCYSFANPKTKTGIKLDTKKYKCTFAEIHPTISKDDLENALVVIFDLYFRVKMKTSRQQFSASYDDNLISLVKEVFAIEPPIWFLWNVCDEFLSTRLQSEIGTPASGVIHFYKAKAAYYLYGTLPTETFYRRLGNSIGDQATKFELEFLKGYIMGQHGNPQEGANVLERVYDTLFHTQPSGNRSVWNRDFIVTTAIEYFKLAGAAYMRDEKFREATDCYIRCNKLKPGSAETEAKIVQTAQDKVLEELESDQSKKNQQQQQKSSKKKKPKKKKDKAKAAPAAEKEEDEEPAVEEPAVPVDEEPDVEEETDFPLDEYRYTQAEVLNKIFSFEATPSCLNFYTGPADAGDQMESHQFTWALSIEEYLPQYIYTNSKVTDNQVELEKNAQKICFFSNRVLEIMAKEKSKNWRESTDLFETLVDRVITIVSIEPPVFAFYEDARRDMMHILQFSKNLLNQLPSSVFVTGLRLLLIGSLITPNDNFDIEWALMYKFFTDKEGVKGGMNAARGENLYLQALKRMSEGLLNEETINLMLGLLKYLNEQLKIQSKKDKSLILKKSVNEIWRLEVLRDNIVLCYNDLAQTALSEENYGQAVGYYEKSLNMKDNENAKEGMVMAQHNIAGTVPTPAAAQPPTPAQVETNQTNLNFVAAASKNSQKPKKQKNTQQKDDFPVGSKPAAKNTKVTAAPAASNSLTSSGKKLAASQEIPDEDFATYGKLGIIQIAPSKILGFGSHGNKVFRGKYDGRPAAIKRMDKGLFGLMEREMDVLLHLSEQQAHPHVIRYFGKDSDIEFIYLAMELGDSTLREFLDEDVKQEKSLLITPQGFPLEQAMTLIMQLLQGVGFLHSLDIVHNDLRLDNILLKNGAVKIADMGLAKQLDDGMFSLTNKPGGIWYAKEVLNPVGKKTKAVDVFTLGIVLFKILTRGRSHPFVGSFEAEIQSSILGNRYDLSAIVHLPDAKHLIEHMINEDYTKRPTCDSVLGHPFFWGPAQKMDYLSNVLLASRTNRNLTSELGKIKDFNNWQSKVNQDVLKDMIEKSKYQGTLISLLTFIRNLREHLHQRPAGIQRVFLGNSTATDPEKVKMSIGRYFFNMFPTLVMEVFKTHPTT